MKKYVNGIQAAFLLIMLTLVNATYALAQDVSTEGSVSKTTTTTDTTYWYAQPWVWIAGIALFILLLAAIMGGRSSSTTERTIIHRDTTDA